MDKVLVQASPWHFAFVDFTEKEVLLGTKQSSVTHPYQSEEKGIHKLLYSYAPTYPTLL